MAKNEENMSKTDKEISCVKRENVRNIFQRKWHDTQYSISWCIMYCVWWALKLFILDGNNVSLRWKLWENVGVINDGGCVFDLFEIILNVKTTQIPREN